MNSERLKRNISLIDQIKRDSVKLKLPIRLDTGERIGTLVPVTWSDASDSSALQRFTDWRNANMGRFLTQFVATPERTERWLSDLVLPNDRQLLFWVLSGETVVGHIGFKELSEIDAMSDNVIRGERDGHPKLFTCANHAMFNWMFDQLDLEAIYGIVFSDNVSAIIMNRQVFKSWERRALQRLTREDGDVWVVGDLLEEDPGERFCWKVCITREEFLGSRLAKD